MRKLLIFLLIFVVATAASAAPRCDGIVASPEDREAYSESMVRSWPRSAQAEYIRQHERHVKPEELPTWNLLNDEERMAINQYTVGSFGDINRQLRADKLELLNTFILLCSGLNKMPAYEGKVIRILDLTPDAFLKISHEGSYLDAAFMSTSKELVLVWKKNTQLLIHTRTGRDIQTFSSHGYEKEVLLMPSTMFRVLRAEEKTGERFQYEIELEEI